MRHTTRVLTEKVHAFTCDRCGRHDDLEHNPFEAQEYVHITTTGGYDSVFEDGAHIAIDLCQHCLKETLGPWLRVTAPSY